MLPIPTINPPGFFSKWFAKKFKGEQEAANRATECKKNMCNLSPSNDLIQTECFGKGFGLGGIEWDVIVRCVELCKEGLKNDPDCNDPTNASCPIPGDSRA